MLVVASVAIAWAWGPREGWNVQDLWTLEWVLGWERLLPFVAFAASLPLLVLCALLIFRRRSDARGGSPPWGAVAWTAPVMVVPIALFTISVLAVDAARSPWTIARQNLGDPQAQSSCGLADHLLIADRTSMTGLSVAGRTTADPVPGWVPPAPLPGIPRYVLTPAEGAVASSPWFGIPTAQPIGFYAAGTQGLGDNLEIEWGRRSAEGIKPLSVGRIPGDPSATLSGTHDWRFVPAAELPGRARGANAARITLPNDGRGWPTTAITAPVTYSNQELGQLLTEGGAEALVSPALLTYMPCTAQPRLQAGVVGVPRYVVMARAFTNLPLMYVTSPFRGVLDLFALERISMADSDQKAHTGLVMFEVHPRVAGGVVAQPDVSAPAT